MDIVSYGIGNKSAKEEAKLRKDILGTGVEGSHPHVRARIDSLEDAIEGVNSLANKLIINDAVNIMKAHAKLNAIAKTTKYKMHNMIFDDLLDLSGIDTSKSSGYTHDSVNGSLKNGSIVTKEEITDIIPSKVVLNVEESTMQAPVLLTGLGSLAYASSQTEEPASKAFNGNTSAYDWWSTKQNPNAWLGVNFGAGVKKVITKYVLYIAGADAPTTWRLEGSNNNSSWDTIDTKSISGVSGTSTNVQVYSFTCNNTTAYQYYRIYVTKNNGSLYYTAINELQLYESFQTSNIIGKYYISRDNGITWEKITPNSLFYFTDLISPQDKKLRLKAELPTGTTLLNYALTWA
ncbi:hypothetical protein C2I27_04185 [Priestia megaterium]|uniref:discoidin domain-containing protein n=1 Tax=Priestia megaterium TaxID=1404 RepID=UPI000D51A25B|nr:discoidin domain-containing protein [Priestia megaterium]PVC75092.1 hypothetical protein C2I27_04185 [Priestia megaterium]